MKRTTIVISFLSFLILPIVLVLSFFYYQKYTVKQNIKHQLVSKISKNELLHLKFSVIDSQTKLFWEHSKEFEFNGEMYDVVKQENHGDSISYYCILDNEETALNQEINKLVFLFLNQNNQEKESKNKLKEFYKNLYLSQCNALLIKSDLINQKFDFLFCAFPLVHQFPNVPPPRFC